MAATQMQWVQNQNISKSSKATKVQFDHTMVRGDGGQFADAVKRQYQEQELLIEDQD
jgi:hypothetical protein